MPVSIGLGQSDLKLLLSSYRLLRRQRRSRPGWWLLRRLRRGEGLSCFPIRRCLFGAHQGQGLSFIEFRRFSAQGTCRYVFITERNERDKEQRKPGSDADDHLGGWRAALPAQGEGSGHATPETLNSENEKHPLALPSTTSIPKPLQVYFEDRRSVGLPSTLWSFPKRGICSSGSPRTLSDTTVSPISTMLPADALS
jgi:hypothetical protein